MSNKRLYSRNRDPFAVDPLPKAHYYPSPEKQLNRTQKATAIKTDSLDDVTENNEGENNLNPADELFLKGANNYQLKQTGVYDNDEDDFNESWPCSERPSATSLPDDSALDIDKYLQFSSIREKLPERIRMPGSYTAGPTLSASKDTGKMHKSKIPVRDLKQSQNGVTDEFDRRNFDKPADDLDTSHQEGSVLQRYVDRFRNSEPMSRDERDRMTTNATSSQDFWWLSNGPPQFPAQKPASRDKHTIDGSSHSSALTRENLDRYRQLQHQAENKKIHGGIPDSPSDKRTIELQERAEKLLEKSSSTVLSTEPAVSTEGLGSNTSTMSSLEEYSHKPTFAHYLEPEVPAKYQTLVSPPLPGQRPTSESDPLYQWRLRRRMELAQQSAPKQTPQFDFLSKTDQQKKMDSKLEEFKHRLAGRVPAKSQVQFTPAPVLEKNAVNIHHTQQTKDNEAWQPQIASPCLHRAKPKSDSQSEVDPHLHLMCDLLPCPHSGKMLESGTSYVPQPGTSTKIDNSVHKCHKGDNCVSEVGEYKQYLEAEKPDIDRSTKPAYGSDKDSDTNLTLTGKRINSIQDIEKMVQDIGRSDSEDVAMETADADDDNDGKVSEQSDKSGSNSARSVTHSKADKQSKISGKESQSVEPAAKQDSKSRKETSIQPKHSSSPKNGRKGVTAAIGQVVKEHLFRTSTGSVLSSVDSLPPSASTERLPSKRTQASHDHNLKQHMNEDETCESDGEFEDDNLLQMLRKQRATYEQQMQQIDEALLKLDAR